MQAKSFFGSLFDYSFSSYITPRIIRVLYVLATILLVLWTLAFVLVAFHASSALGILTLLIIGPLFFVIAMIYARVGLELISAFFRIQGDVDAMNLRAGGAGVASVAHDSSSPETGLDRAVEASAAEPSSVVAPVVASSSTPEAPGESTSVARFCEHCGAARVPGRSFCTACGGALA